MNSTNSVGPSIKSLTKEEMQHIYGAAGDVYQPQTTPIASAIASFVASYISSAEFRCGKDNK
ncbi:lichenicidin A2 family type 2 lantibiotic [Rossellomorea vietnamensis]|uniref:Type 2 lantibiotic n=1 Tax=Rossellomorea aquimaris TaxID=189382 RepID=A0A5D4TKA7_9BACI|nr:mersacidin family lantibiotic [Rossellomorea aquimaris]TYS75755.1 type 2 lantibiotic [Rossellomorea aquimaris]